MDERIAIADKAQLRTEFEGLYDALLAKGEPVGPDDLARALNHSFRLSDELDRELRILIITKMIEGLVHRLD
jgi:hypothetical protein